MPAKEKVAWEKDPRFVMRRTTCDVCGEEGLMRQAWDELRFICVQPGPCMKRWRETVGYSE